MKNRMTYVLTIALMATFSLGAADSTGENDPSTATTVRGAFPNGLPEGAVAIDKDTVSFEDGKVILELGGEKGYYDCPYGWLCLFQDKDWEGRMLQFQDTGSWQNLTDYGFNDAMSSWRNRRSADSKWAWHINGNGTRRCMDSHSATSYVGSGDNDEASSIINYTLDGHC